ncbi:hypothetical protein Csa_015211 [Cucumis sativus]|uniref:Uncharacterized protein n=1 Tax=Cucumis sativus TaxID=3659 RepID=A0A0A0KZU9_CUCSA|nr:hypothetical protein Csa_015211 [Cucumis sativus]
MGNCVEVLSRQREEDGTTTTTSTREMEEREKKGGMRIKVVLRKEELEWLTEQIKEKGGKCLEELLEEIERGRREKTVMNCSIQYNVSWKPSLESIMECPEIPDHMFR